MTIGKNLAGLSRLARVVAIARHVGGNMSTGTLGFVEDAAGLTREITVVETDPVHVSTASDLHERVVQIRVIRHCGRDYRVSQGWCGGKNYSIPEIVLRADDPLLAGFTAIPAGQ